MASAAPTERELQILKILWDMGTATVRQVYERMRLEEDGKDLAQNTVQTFLRMMEDKGLVEHTVEGRAFIYRPLYTRQRTVSRFVQRVFDGAVDQLVMNALKVKKLSDEEIGSIERLIAEARSQRQKSA